MRPLRGIAYKVVSVIVFIVMASMIKATAPDVPSGEAVFFRSFFAMPVIVLWLASRRELATGFAASNPMGHVWRGLVGTLAMGLGFAGLGYLPLPEVTAIGYAAPLLTVIFAAMFLGEEVRAFRISAVILGLIGVLIVVWPRLSITSGGHIGQAEAFGAILVLGGRGVCSPCAGFCAQAGDDRENPGNCVLLFADGHGLIADNFTFRLGCSNLSSGNTADRIRGIGRRWSDFPDLQLPRGGCVCRSPF